MLQVTPENVFVFYSLEAILCGLLVFGLAWGLYKKSSLRKHPRLFLLLGAISALGLGFFICSSLGFYDFYFQEKLIREKPEDIAFSFFLVATLLFGIASNPTRPLKKAPALLLVAGAGLGLADLLFRVTDSWGSHLSIHWIGIALLLALFILMPPMKVRQTPRGVLFLALLGLILSFLLFFFSVQFPHGRHTVLVWAFKHLAILGSLIALSRVVELETQALFIKSFIRLNLTFVLLAGFIILLVTGMERQAYAGFAAREAADLMEFLRSHVMYFDSQGENSDGILNNPEITNRIVSDFGRLTDLRSVAIHLNEYQLNMAIHSNGLIDRSLEKASSRPGDSPPSAPVIEGNFLGLFLPVFSGKEINGYVKFTESLTVMNKRIAHQIMIIFSAFTIVVIFGSILVGIIVNQADATIRQQYGEIEETHRQLFQASKLAALGEMAGGVAHEINNPLGVIMGRSEYLIAMAKLQGANDFLEDLEVLRRNASRMARIISDLLDYARIHDLNRNTHDVNNLLRDTVELMTPRLASQELSVIKELSAVPAISVDWHQMQQVLVNLINNAIDASPCGGSIRLQTNHDRQRSVVEIEIEDGGAGISENHIKKIFDPFFTTKERGTGLGLSISYRIVRDHGGEISVRSVAHQGTRFTITLPVLQVEAT